MGGRAGKRRQRPEAARRRKRVTPSPAPNKAPDRTAPPGGLGARAQEEAGEWLTLAQARAYLQIGSAVTLRKLIREEGLPVADFGGRVVRTKREWLDAWAAERRRKQPPPR